MVWVGFDDNRELNLEGAHSAAPIWAEFMKRALANPRIPRHQAVRRAGRHRLDRYRSAVRHAGHSRTARRMAREVYISGTQPVGACPLHGGGRYGDQRGWMGQCRRPPPPAARSRPARDRFGTAMARCSPAPCPARRPPGRPAGGPCDGAGRRIRRKSQKRREEGLLPASNGCV